MNKTIAYFLLTSLIFVACRQPKKNINRFYKPSEEAEITTLVFDAVVPSDTTFKKKLLREEYREVEGLFNPGKERDEYIEHQKRELDTLRKELDTAKIYVLLADTLIRLPKYYLKLADSGNYTDTVLNNWAKEIVINEEPGKFNIQNLDFNYNYMYALKSKFKIPGGKAFYAGTIKMSSIFFNKEKTKAFVDVEIVKRIGFSLFLSKNNGRWVIIKKEIDWIS